MKAHVHKAAEDEARERKGGLRDAFESDRLAIFNVVDLARPIGEEVLVFGDYLDAPGTLEPGDDDVRIYVEKGLIRSG